MKIGEVVESLERQDLYWVSRNGLPEDVARQITALCTEYRSKDFEGRVAMRSVVSGRAGWLIFALVSRMALAAMRGQDQEALAKGILALNLSNIAQVDYRDSYAPIAKLAYAAQQCGVDLADYAMEICPETPAAFIAFMRKPGPVKVGPDAEGNLEFQVTDEAKARQARHKEFIKEFRQKRADLKAKPESQ